MLAHCFHFLGDGRCEHVLFLVATAGRGVSDQPTPSPDDQFPAGESAALQCFPMHTETSVREVFPCV